MSLKGNIKSLKIFQFDAIELNGVVQKTKPDNSKEVVYVNNQYTFNKQGMIIEHQEFISDELSQRFTYEYDNDLNILKKHYYNQKGDLINTSNYENIHDSSGNLIEEKEFMTGKHFENNWTQKIFKNKNETNKNVYVGEEIYKTYEYIYDKQNNRTEENRINTDGTLYLKIISSYNKDGLRDNQTVTDGNGIHISKEIYKFSNFDLKNNWNKISIYRDDILCNIIESEIEYY